MTITENHTGLLPKRPRGRPSRTFSMDAHQARIKRFCDLIQQIHSTMDFRVGSRGWCYILERHGLLKGDFKDAEKLITEFRKSGDLPLDICAEDDSRGTIGLEQLDSNDIPQQVDSWVEHQTTPPPIGPLTTRLSRVDFPASSQRNILGSVLPYLTNW
jgi:hypothetical protein